MLTREEVLRELAEAVIKRDRKKVEELAHQVVAEKIDAFEAINKGLAAGMAIVGQKGGLSCHRAAAQFEVGVSTASKYPPAECAHRMIATSCYD
jgi:B12 binding domain